MPIVSIENLETRFKRQVVHCGLNLAIEPGETLVLLGGSGAGKSTLLRTLIGLEIPYRGAIHYQDRNLCDLTEREWRSVRQRIAYAFQGGALFDSLTVEENLEFPLLEHTALGPDERRDRIHAALERLGLDGTQKLLPGALSGGMQKRAGLARATILDPEIILYDEPTAGLDPMNGKKIAESIALFKSMGKTSVVVTHDIPCALAVADRIAFIHGGKIAALQTIADVHAHPDTYIHSYLEGEEIQ